jgi:DtxR family transcriptional regulator, Mn-dependent transcriptional regulator
MTTLQKTHTETEENYLKGVLRFSQGGQPVSTNTLANYLGTSPASVTDMLKKLHEKELVRYTRYKGATLSEEGRRIALRIVRKHRLWEVFLVEKLNFAWDNVHEVAEQLEHIDSPELVRAIDEFLGYPKFDPHGDPIPSEDGQIETRETLPLTEVGPGTAVSLAGVRRSDPDFLQYLDRTGLTLGAVFQVIEALPFDDSMQLQLAEKTLIVSGAVAKNLLVLVDNPA